MRQSANLLWSLPLLFLLGCPGTQGPTLPGGSTPTPTLTQVSGATATPSPNDSSTVRVLNSMSAAVTDLGGGVTETDYSRPVTFKITVCNDGPVLGFPVSLMDNVSGSYFYLQGWEYLGMYPYVNGTGPDPAKDPTVMNFGTMGIALLQPLAHNECVTLSAVYANQDPGGSLCQTYFHNVGTYIGMGVSVSGDPTTLVMPCVSPFPTSTPSNSSTATSTRTLTSTPTETATKTDSPTATGTPTVTETSTVTLTSTRTPLCAGGILFGRTDVGPSSATPLPNSLNLVQYHLSQPGTVTGLVVHLSQPNGQAMVGLYEDAAGKPGDLLSGSSVQTETDGWNAFDVPDVEIPVGDYWLAYQGSGNSRIHYGGSSSPSYHLPNSFGSFPVSISAGVTANLSASFYAEVCLPSGSLSATPTPTATDSGTPTHTGTPTFTETPYCVSPLQFGKTFLGGSNSPVPPGYLNAVKYNLPQDAVVTGLHIALSNPAGEARAALYKETGELVSQSAPQVPQDGWNSFEIPDAALPAGNYWLVFQATGGVSLPYDSVPNASYHVTQTYGLFPGTLPSGGFSFSIEASFYADYCPLLTPIPTPSFTPTVTPTPTLTVPCSAPETFGKTALGGLAAAPPASWMNAVKYHLPEDGTVTDLDLYLTSVGGQALVALYGDASGVPSGLLVVSTSQPLVNGWNRFNLPATPLLAGDYWLTYQGNASAQVHFDNVPSASYHASNSYGSFPGTFPLGGYQFVQASFYARYCLAPWVPTHTLTETPAPTDTPTITPTATATEAPLCADPITQGETEVGALSYSGKRLVGACPVTLTTDGTVVRLSAYVPDLTGSGIRMALYEDDGSGSQPSTLLAQSEEVSPVLGWNSLDLPDSPVTAGVYWVAVQTDGVIASAAGAQDRFLSTAGLGPFPSDLSGASGGQEHLSLYLDLCLASGAPTPQPTATKTPSFTTTPTATNTSTPTGTDSPTATLTDSPTETETSTETDTPSFTPTESPTPTETATRTITSTPCASVGYAGPVSQGSLGANVIRANPYVFSASTVYSIHLYNNGAPASFVVGLYQNGAGVPTTRVAQSAATLLGNGWNEVPLTTFPSLAAGTFWLACMGDVGGGMNSLTGSPPMAFSGTTAFGALPGTFPVLSTTPNTQVWMYADLCP